MVRNCSTIRTGALLLGRAASPRPGTSLIGSTNGLTSLVRAEGFLACDTSRVSDRSSLHWEALDRTFSRLFVNDDGSAYLDLRDVRFVDAVSLVAIAAQCLRRIEQGSNVQYLAPSSTKVRDFCEVLGLSALLTGETTAFTENGRRRSYTSRVASAEGPRLQSSEPLLPLTLFDAAGLNQHGWARNEEEIARQLAGCLRRAAISDPLVRFALDGPCLELLSNVAEHAKTGLGVMAAQVTNYKGRPTIFVAVADPGIGFVGSLRGRFGLLSDDEAMRVAVESTATSDPGRGLGLHILSTRIRELRDASLMLASGRGRLRISGDSDLRPTLSDHYFPGTCVVAKIPNA